MAKLARSVFARDESGTWRIYTPSDDVPAAVAKSITRPGVWADEDDAPKAAKPKRKSPTKKPVKPAEGTVQETPDQTPPAPSGTDEDGSDDDTDPDGEPDGDGVGTAGTE